MKTYNVISNYITILHDERALVITDLESSSSYYITKKYYYKCECSYSALFSVEIDKESKGNYIKNLFPLTKIY